MVDQFRGEQAAPPLVNDYDDDTYHFHDDRKASNAKCDGSKRSSRDRFWLCKLFLRNFSFMQTNR